MFIKKSEGKLFQHLRPNRSVNDQHDGHEERQEEEEKHLYSLNRLQKSIWFGPTRLDHRNNEEVHSMAQSFCQEIQLNIPELITFGKQQKKTPNEERSPEQGPLQAEEQIFSQSINQTPRSTCRQNCLIEVAHVNTSEMSNWSNDICNSRTSHHQEIYIFKTEISDLCRVCRTEKETHRTHYLGMHCAPTKYLKRHDNVCRYIHGLLLLDGGIIGNKIIKYEHQPRAVEESKSTKILWTSPKLTTNPDPDIAIVDKRSNKATIIDVANPDDLARKRFDK